MNVWLRWGLGVPMGSGDALKRWIIKKASKHTHPDGKRKQHANKPCPGAYSRRKRRSSFSKAGRNSSTTFNNSNWSMLRNKFDDTEVRFAKCLGIDSIMLNTYAWRHNCSCSNVCHRQKKVDIMIIMYELYSILSISTSQKHSTNKGVHYQHYCMWQIWIMYRISWWAWWEAPTFQNIDSWISILEGFMIQFNL